MVRFIYTMAWEIQGKFYLKEIVQAEVDHTRQDVMLNHSATHLLHEALRRVLGDHVVQKGSLVAADRLRFDFSHTKPLTNEQIRAVEDLVNRAIRADVPSKVEETTLEEAKRKGAVALFGEKYGNIVRTVKMGEFSQEVCGGTHVSRTGQIGIFKIIAQMPSAAGIRRIEAVTGAKALEWIAQMEDQLQELVELLKIEKPKVVEKLVSLLNEQRVLSKEVIQLKQALANQQSKDLQNLAVNVGDIKVLAIEIKAVDRETLRQSMDQLKSQLGRSAIVLATIQEGKVQLICGVSKDCLTYFSAVELLQQVTRQIDGRGGGRPDLAQGGGENPQALPAALESVVPWVRGKISGE